MPERSRSPQGPRHVAPGGELQPWWRALDARRLWVAVGASLLALPLLVLDNLPEGTRGTAEAVETVETVARSTGEPTTSSSPSSTSTTSTTAAPTTTAAPATTEAPATTAAPTTAPPTTRPAAPPSTRPAPPPTAPPTTAAPAPPPPAGSIESIIRAHFGDAGDQAIAVARCESGLNPNAIGGGGRYFGLFQIGSSHSAAFEQVTGRAFDSAWSDPDANTQYARWLYSQSGWSAWGCA